jgi:hypothetical protein
MRSRSFFRDALNHREGRIPLDFGATAVTGIHCSIVAGLRDYYGLERRPVRIHEPYQMLGLIEEDLLEAMEVDVVGVNSRNTLFGFPLGDWKPWRTPWGQEVLVPGLFNTSRTNDGAVLIYPKGDFKAPPSGRMPKGGYFFDTIIRQSGEDLAALEEDNLDPELNLEEFGLLEDEELAWLRHACLAAEETGRGIIANFGGTAIGDIALVPAPGLTHPRGIRDVTEWYIATAARQDYLHEVFSRQTEIALQNLARLHEAVGDIPDAVFICGTDFVTQTSQFCSPDTFEHLYAPYYRRINSWIHARTQWKTFKHSCGAVASFMPLFIEAGFDIINPVQCSAAGMDPEFLKREYGRDLVFWGGSVDTQNTLPFGTPDEVRAEVRKRLEVFSAGGGFVCNTIHNVQAGTPLENLAAFLDTVRKFRDS